MLKPRRIREKCKVTQLLGAELEFTFRHSSSNMFYNTVTL